MALVANAVTPTQATASSGVASSTTNFSPSSGAIVYVLFTYMFGTNTAGVTFTVADSHSNSYSLNFTPLNNGGSGATYVGIANFTYSSAPGNTTVKITASNTGQADCLITPYWFTGQAASQTGAAFASNTNGSSGTTCEQLITPTATGSYIVIAGGVAAVTVNSTAISGTTLGSSWNDATVGNSANSGITTSASTGGVQVNVGFTLSGTSTFGYSIAALEVLPQGGSADQPKIQPGPTWFDLFKPGMPKPRPYLPLYQGNENGPLTVPLPTLVTSINSLTYLPSDMPQIMPGPAWLDQFKPGMPRSRPQSPPYPYRTAGESGPINAVIPTLVTSITSVTFLPLDQPNILPGPTWLDQFKPGMPRSRPLVPPPPPTKLVTAPLAILLPTLVTGLATRDIRSPENMGAVLTLPSPNGSTIEVVEGATCIVVSYGGTIALVTLNATTVGWTMQTAPLNLLEFNDVTIDIAITQNGSPFNLTSATVNMLFKSQAGTPDSSALIFSSSGGSPAITITNAAGGLCVAQIPNVDLDSEVYFFYRIDVVVSGLQNTCLSGPIVWTSL